MTLPLGFAENSIQLVPDGTLLLHILIILVMIFVLNATLYKPINRILEAREKRTKGRLSEAEEIINSVNEKLSDYERQLRQAHVRIQCDLVDDASQMVREPANGCALEEIVVGMGRALLISTDDEGGRC